MQCFFTILIIVLYVNFHQTQNVIHDVGLSFCGTSILPSAESPMSLPPGTQLGPFEIVAPLGAGGMGPLSPGEALAVVANEVVQP